MNEVKLCKSKLDLTNPLNWSFKNAPQIAEQANCLCDERFKNVLQVFIEKEKISPKSTTDFLMAIFIKTLKEEGLISN